MNTQSQTHGQTDRQSGSQTVRQAGRGRGTHIFSKASPLLSSPLRLRPTLIHCQKISFPFGVVGKLGSQSRREGGDGGRERERERDSLCTHTHTHTHAQTNETGEIDDR